MGFTVWKYQSCLCVSCYTKSVRSSARMRNIVFVLLLLSAGLLLLGETVMVMPVLFAVLFLYGAKLQFRSARFLKAKIFCTVLAFSLLFEVAAILKGYGTNEFGGGTLFHPNPGLDILISLLYWVPYSVFWTHLFTRYSYTPKKLFLLGGSYGVLTEQFFFIPLLLFTLNPFVLVAAPYVFVLYGGAIAAPYLILERILPHDKPVDKRQYWLPMVALFPMLAIVFVLAHVLVGGW